MQIYRRTWGGEAGADAELGEAVLGAVQARMRGLTARAPAHDHAHLMHKYLLTYRTKPTSLTQLHGDFYLFIT